MKQELKGFITKEEAIELLNKPLQEGESTAGRLQLVMTLLDPSIDEECECCNCSCSK